MRHGGILPYLAIMETAMKFDWQSLLNRFRGFDIPVVGGGVAWEPPPLRKDLAQQVITFLEETSLACRLT
jgi:hypothetical protein